MTDDFKTPQAHLYEDEPVWATKLQKATGWFAFLSLLAFMLYMGWHFAYGPSSL